MAELVGVEERFLVRAARGNIATHTTKQQHALAIHNRFYTALILNDLVNEMPLNAVARKYACARGQLQSLQQNAATFAGKHGMQLFKIQQFCIPQLPTHPVDV